MLKAEGKERCQCGLKTIACGECRKCVNPGGNPRGHAQAHVAAASAVVPKSLRTVSVCAELISGF